MLREEKEELEWCAVKDFFFPLQYSLCCLFVGRSVGPSIRFSSYMDFFQEFLSSSIFFYFSFFGLLSTHNWIQTNLKAYSRLVFSFFFDNLSTFLDSHHRHHKVKWDIWDRNSSFFLNLRINFFFREISNPFSTLFTSFFSSSYIIIILFYEKKVEKWIYFSSFPSFSLSSFQLSLHPCIEDLLTTFCIFFDGISKKILSKSWNQ